MVQICMCFPLGMAVDTARKSDGLLGIVIERRIHYQCVIQFHQLLLLGRISSRYGYIRLMTAGRVIRGDLRMMFPKT